MIQVNNHGETENLYHHYDGHFTGVGLDMAFRLNEWDYSGSGMDWRLFNGRLPKLYEDVSHIPEEQSNLDYVYTLDLTPQGIVFKGYDREDWNNSHINWRNWKSKLIYRLSLGDDKVWDRRVYISVGDSAA